LAGQVTFGAEEALICELADAEGQSMLKGNCACLGTPELVEGDAER